MSCSQIMRTFDCDNCYSCYCMNAGMSNDKSHTSRLQLIYKSSLKAMQHIICTPSWCKWTHLCRSFFSPHCFLHLVASDSSGLCKPRLLPLLVCDSSVLNWKVGGEPSDFTAASTTRVLWCWNKSTHRYSRAVSNHKTGQTDRQDDKLLKMQTHLMTETGEV